MRALLLLTAVAAAITGCTAKEETTETTATEGPYQGIGVYGAGSGWARIATPPAEQGSRAASLADDDHVIVVTDSRTGEVRQCGDLSGYCITFNPWSAPLDATRKAPVTLEPLRDEKGRIIERMAGTKLEETTTVTTTPSPQ